MDKLFTPYPIGSLEIPNRLVRSATAEKMADDSGRPSPMLMDLYRTLARGGVGLIITGYMYVHPSGKAHQEMVGIHSDELIPDLQLLAQAVHEEGGKVAVQINHGGMNVDKTSVTDPLAPSDYLNEANEQIAREMTTDEIAELIQAFGQAARRVKEAGFDGVQIHSAHGYLISQFLSPVANRRTDKWGGDIHSRMSLLKEVYYEVRRQVGDDFPVFVKLGMVDGVKNGLTLEEGLEVVKACEEFGMDAIEISGGFKYSSVQKGIRRESEEAYFLPWAEKIRPMTKLPLLLVGGMRSKTVMERVISDGHADFVSLCRPLINDPDFPNKLRLGELTKSECISSNNCWPENKGVGIACKCPTDKVRG